MTVLGVLSAAMVTVFKPHQHKAQAMLNLKQKAYGDIDLAVQSVLTDCTDKLNIFRTYRKCNRANELISANDALTRLSVLNLFLRGTIGGCDDMVETYDNPSIQGSLKLRNGVCIFATTISYYLIDVNGKEGPNDALDRFTIAISPKEGVISDMPTKPISAYACGKAHCVECSGSSCTKCYCGYLLSNGKCVAERFWIEPGCTEAVYAASTLYSDSNCTNVAVPTQTQYCGKCTSESSSQDLYYMSDSTCKKGSHQLKTCTAPGTECEPY